MAKIAENPWGLTLLQALALDALVTTGTDKGVCNLLGITHDAARARLAFARIKMGRVNRIRMSVMWAQYRGEDLVNPKKRMS